ncbi:hypothetical protein D515_01928 [Grimontia indica]|uniref:Uncharacterized protein n=1 Tax=Grimontia indica TaxID=1056512 RepID=R1GT69_9GAMM|nr:hypothetical protein D515_01928 [Grimontia indica]
MAGWNQQILLESLRDAQASFFISKGRETAYKKRKLPTSRIQM